MGGGDCFPPPLWFILINLKMAYIRTLKLLHFFKHHSCEQILQKKKLFDKGKGGEWSNGRLVFKKSEMVNNILRYRAKKKVRGFFMSRPKSWTMDMFNTPLSQL